MISICGEEQNCVANRNWLRKCLKCVEDRAIHSQQKENNGIRHKIEQRVALGMLGFVLETNVIQSEPGDSLVVISISAQFQYSERIYKRVGKEGDNASVRCVL